ncbi:RagB/SusD family nutrient uptake outer membrane protein [Chitinophaga pollutisoli]|uniref:RagB/SusD family nutrient uptake outer membrane protein n=1 Tax=Chitinophaga pollutisoli TaxID=3133966 RepID=A0ABZ2YLK8_9BACT
MRKKDYRYIFILFVLVGLLAGCNKYLEDKPIQSLTTIDKLQDLQALLNNDINAMRYSANTTLAADEYYFPASVWSALPQPERGAYNWESENYLDAWRQAYITVNYANVVLQSLEKIEAGTVSQRNDIRGQALFQRAFAFYELAQVYCRPFSATANTDPGIALRTVPDLEVPSKRGTVGETYARITGDLIEAAGLLLPEQQYVSRPFQSSAYGLLARTYLAMGDYDNAFKYADLYLQKTTALVDFNDVDSTATPVFKAFTTEIAYRAYAISQILPRQPPVDSNLYKLYADDDLRKAVYFLKKPDGTSTFKGSYSILNGNQPFNGIATDEIFLIRAEASARLGNTQSAMQDLNALLKKRWRKGLYTDRVAANKEEALELILTERRKELVYRGTRWTDLRRFNLEGKNITLRRNIDGTVYELPANDKRWVWLLPLNVIQLSGMPQNER